MHPPLRTLATALLAGCAFISDKDEAARLDADGDGIDWLDDCDDNDKDKGGPQIWYQDDDGDGYGSGVSIEHCLAPENSTLITGDCNDGDPAVSPDAEEICNDVDDDCDDRIDEGLVHTTWYSDSDGDGFGDPSTETSACAKPTGHVEDDTDCDDTDAGSHPEGTETCDSADNNCNGEVDEGVSTTIYADADDDGHGDPDVTVEACFVLVGYAATGTDCDDADSTVFPGAAEVCEDSKVNDCNSDWDDAVDTCENPHTVSAHSADATIFGVTTASGLTSLAGAGDTNGDGYNDILIGVSASSTVYLVNGPVRLEMELSTADAALTSDGAEGLGNAVASAGDMNGDGLADILIGASARDSAHGGVYVVHGPVDPETELDAEHPFLLEGTSGWWQLGKTVAGIGDVDSDGLDDAIAAYDNGVALIYGYGSATEAETFDVIITGAVSEDAEFDGLGQSIAGAGDVDGDGIDDFLLGAPMATGAASEYGGTVYLMLNDLRESAGPAIDVTDDDAGSTAMHGEVSGLEAGWTVAGPGDVNGDGEADILVGTNPAGTSNIVGYLITEPTLGSIPDMAQATFHAPSDDEADPVSIAGAGDTNNDEKMDVLIGLSAVNEWSGAAYLVLGDVSIGAIDLSGDADTRLIGDTSGDWVGGTVAGLGDTNLDDYDDILVGASGADSEEVDVGAAYLLLGAGP